jgi:hypothetical protein
MENGRMRLCLARDAWSSFCGYGHPSLIEHSGSSPCACHQHKKEGRKGVDKGKVMSIIGKLLEKRCHLQEEVHPSQKNKKDRQKWKPVFFYV